MYASRATPPLPRGFYLRLARHSAFALALVGGSLEGAMAGYHYPSA
jgi:hypothetical protein